MRAYSTNSNPLAAFNIPGITDSGSSLSGIGYDPTSLASIQNFGLPSFGSTPAPASNMWTDIFGKDGKAGYANTALDLVKGGFGMWAGMKGLGLAKDQFNMQKQVTNLNMDMMKKNYNQTLEGKHRNMIAAMGQDEAAKQGILSVADQLKKYGA